MKTTLAHRLTLLAVTLLAAGCQQVPVATQTKPQPIAPQITESSLRDRAAEQLAAGVKQYDAGDYDNAVKNLMASLDHGLLSKVDQSRARKYLAFSHCVSSHELLCRDEFRKAFEIYPEFALTSAEDGHPSWGPIYRNVRTQLITEREAAQARSRPIIPLSASSAPARSIDETAMSTSCVRMISVIGSLCTSTSNIERSISSGFQPWDIVRLPCGSMSTQSTRWPFSANAAARFSVVVVFATPPF